MKVSAYCHITCIDKLEDEQYFVSDHARP
jgi:hypothetical protein